MVNWNWLARFTYLEMQVAIIGGAFVFVVLFHLPVLWRQWRTLLLATALIVLYGTALDAWAIRSGWGWFNPALTSGIWFGSLLLEEAIFWLGTAFVTVAAALVMAEAIDHGIPWWALPVVLMFPSWLWLNTPESILAGANK